MFCGKKVSVVMPAFNEGEAIGACVREFVKTGYADEIVVADNNSTDKTAIIAKKAGARVVCEKNQGYGFACQRALKEASGYYVVLVEPDGTFDPEDILKFLAYSKDFDFVLGTRTSRELIWEGSNMGPFLKWGNWMLAKSLELMHNGPHLSDVGCTYRLIKRPSLEKISGRFTVGGSHFSPEMMILALKCGIRTIEIPVNYRPRRGESKITGKKSKAFKVGLAMIRLIISYVFK
jgi:glycosyltransferase involved in cell wall biosynthesis